MATIPTQRDRAATTTAAAFDPFPGRAVRAEAQRDLGRAQSIINLTGTVVNVAGQLGTAFANSRKRTAQAKFNADLEQVSTELKAEFPDDPEAFQEQYLAHVADLTDNQPFLGKEAQFVAEARMARDLGTIIQSQITLQKQEDLAGLNSQERIFTSQAQDLNPVVSGIKIAEYGALVDASVEDRIITAQDGEQRKHNIQFNAERGIARLLPTTTAIEGLRAAKLMSSATPEQRDSMINELVSENNAEQTAERSIQTGIDKATKKKFQDTEDAVTLTLDQMILEDGAIDPEFLRSQLPNMKRAVRDNYIQFVRNTQPSQDDGPTLEGIATKLDDNDLDGARADLSSALTVGLIKTSTFLSITDHIRTMRGDLTPAQESGVTILKDALRPIAGDPGGYMDRAGMSRAQRDYRNWMRANPTAPFEQHEAKADELVLRYQRVAYDKMVTAEGVPVELGPVAQSDVTQELLAAGFELLKESFSSGVITEDDYRSRAKRYTTWRQFVERRDANTALIEARRKERAARNQ